MESERGGSDADPHTLLTVSIQFTSFLSIPLTYLFLSIPYLTHPIYYNIWTCHMLWNVYGVGKRWVRCRSAHPADRIYSIHQFSQHSIDIPISLHSLSHPPNILWYMDLSYTMECVWSLKEVGQMQISTPADSVYSIHQFSQHSIQVDISRLWFVGSWSRKKAFRWVSFCSAFLQTTPTHPSVSFRIACHPPKITWHARLTVSIITSASSHWISPTQC